MPPTRSVGAAALALLGALAFAYSLLLAHQPLLGLTALALCLLGAFAVHGGVDPRQALTGAVIVLVVLLGFVLERPLLAVVAACAVYVTAWLTGPNGPSAE